MSQKEKGIGHHLYTDDEIKKMLAQGLSNYKIARYYHVSPKRVTRISKGETCKSRGGQGKFTDEQIEFVKNTYKENPQLTFDAIRDKFKEKFSISISYGKVSNIIGKNKGRLLTPNNRKIDQINEIYELTEGKQYKNKIDFTQLVFKVNSENINDIAKELQDHIAEDAEYLPFLIELLSYFTLIRPLQRKFPLQIFSLIAVKFSDFIKETISKIESMREISQPKGYDIFSCLLQAQGMIKSYSIPENTTPEEINQNFIEIYQPETLEYYIINDDIHKIQEYTINSVAFDYTKSLFAKVANSSQLIQHESMTLLDFSAYYGALKAFKFFSLNDAPYSEIHIKNYSIFGGNQDIVNFLIQKEISYDNTLKYCIQYQRYDLTKMVLDNFQCEDVSLFDCLIFLNLEAFLFLLHNSTKSNKTNSLFSICSCKDSYDMNIIKLLIQSGADINKEKQNHSLLYEICGKENNDFKNQLVHLLIRKNVDVNKGAKTTTPLYALCKQASPNAELIELLLENNADVNLGEKTPLYALCNTGKKVNPDLLNLLLNNGADANKGQISPLTALCYHSNLGNLNNITLLINKGANVNPDGVLPLTAACESENSEISIIQLLIQSGADVNRQSVSMKDPDSLVNPLKAELQNEQPNYNIISFLLDCGADPNKFESLVSIVLNKKHVNLELLKLLIKAGTNISENEIEILKSKVPPTAINDILKP